MKYENLADFSQGLRRRGLALYSKTSQSPENVQAIDMAGDVVAEFARCFRTRLYQVKVTGDVQTQSPLMLTLASMRQNYIAIAMDWGIDEMDAYEIWFRTVENHPLARWAVKNLSPEDAKSASSFSQPV